MQIDRKGQKKGVSSVVSRAGVVYRLGTHKRGTTTKFNTTIT